MANIFRHSNMVMRYSGGEGDQFKMYGFETVNTNSPDVNRESHPNYYLTTAGYDSPSLEDCGSLCGHGEGEK